MYKQASQLKLRFSTAKGPLSVDQLWDLSLAELDALAVSLEAEMKASAKKSFLTTKNTKDRAAKLRFDIALDILNTKVEEAEAAQKRKDTRERNQKIMAIIEKKQDAALEDKSVSELKRLLKETEED